MHYYPNKSISLSALLIAVAALSATSLRANLIPLGSSSQTILAATAPVTSTVTYKPNPVDLNDLDHHMVYTWRIDNITVTPANITGATLTIKNIANWDNNPNVLHLHLLDTAKNAGVASFTDDPTGSSPVTDFTDDFKNARFHGNAGWLVALGTKDTFLQDVTFTMNPTTFTYELTGDSLAALQAYIANGKDIAFGFDPDCHFFNDGISFTITSVTPVPEMSTILPICVLLSFAVGLEVRRRRRAVTA